MRAIDIARKQGAKSLELRAAMSLGRLWRDQGKTKKARRLVEGAYATMTEGFITRDMLEAKALIESLPQ